MNSVKRHNKRPGLMTLGLGDSHYEGMEGLGKKRCVKSEMVVGSHVCALESRGQEGSKNFFMVWCCFPSGYVSLNFFVLLPL